MPFLCECDSEAIPPNCISEFIRKPYSRKNSDEFNAYGKLLLNIKCEKKLVRDQSEVLKHKATYSQRSQNSCSACKGPSYRTEFWIFCMQEAILQDGDSAGHSGCEWNEYRSCSSMACPFWLLRHLSLKMIAKNSVIVINCIWSLLLPNMIVYIWNTGPITKLKKNVRSEFYLSQLQNTQKGEKCFVCNECGNAFLEKLHLTWHPRTHTGKEVLQWNNCGKTWETSKPWNLRDHIRRLHEFSPLHVEKPFLQVSSHLILENTHRWETLWLSHTRNIILYEFTL